jgi:hypothetical protein
MHTIRMLNSNGDDALAVWDPADEITTAEASKRFDELIAQNYLLVRADDGTRDLGERIRKFDRMAKVIFVIKCSNFAGG